MASLALSIIAVFALWYLSGLGLGYYLTRRTPLARYFPLLGLFFAQILFVVGRSFGGLATPDGISTASLWVLHGIGLLCTGAAVREIGLARLPRLYRFRLGLPLLVLLLIAAISQMAPCLVNGDFCYVSHLNDEYLNYSSNAQWLMGRAPGTEFEQGWKMLGPTRFGAELMLAYLAQTVAVPPVYVVSLLQAIERVQYVAAVFVFLPMVFPGHGRMRWIGALATAAALLLSPLEAENYVLAFLAHHSASSAIVVLGATVLFPVSRRLAFLQGVVLLYIGLTYIEVLAPAAAIMASQYAWQSWLDRTIRPLVSWGAVCAIVGLTFEIREPGMLTRFVAGLAGGNRAGFPMLGVPDGISGDYVASLASLHAGIIGVAVAPGWPRLFSVLAALILLGAGLWFASARRRQLWIVVALVFVVVAHFDRVALLAGEWTLMQPVYQGPKAYLYFHYLWIVVAVGGAVEIMRKSIGIGVAALGVWLIPAALLGASFSVRLAHWPAVWTAAGDISIAAKLKSGEVVPVLTRPGEEKLWKQLLAFTGSGARLQASGSAQLIGPTLVARHRYSARGMEIQALRAQGVSCAAPLAASNGFELCASTPGLARGEFRLQGRLTAWDTEWQPLVTCGTTGDAVFVGMKKDGEGRAVLTIDEWGIPTVFGAAFPVTAGEPFELLVRLGRQSGEVSAEHGGGAKVFHRLVSKTKLDVCAAVIGRNDIGATTVAKAFHGELKDILAPQP